jgi:hypothetical protein
MKLEMRSGFLDDPIRLDLAQLESQMLWPPTEPENAIHRARWVDGAIVAEAATMVDTLDHDLLRKAFMKAAHTPPLADLQKAAGDRYGHGWVAGAILRIAVGDAALANGKAHKGDVIGFLVESYSEFHVKGQLHFTPSRKNIDNVVWPTFAPVAHFWAAWLIAYSSGNKTFPCKLDNLAIFLATAERFRQLGEATQTKQGPILKPGQALELPNGLELPEVDIQFEPIRTS